MRDQKIWWKGFVNRILVLSFGALILIHIKYKYTMAATAP